MDRLPSGWRRVSLETIAHIQTGLAKGGKTTGRTVELPYLRVANVQDGYLDLSEVKTILIEESKVDRYLLQVGDILLTEGGDFDKLGRGTVWYGEIPSCLHQNHVFAVRLDQDLILPEFLSMQAGSPYGKQYFLSCAKQTTNLASINKTQLAEFPVLLPSLVEQKAITNILSTWDEAIATVDALLAALRRRKQGLMQRLLTGQVRFGEFVQESKTKHALGTEVPYDWDVIEFAEFADRDTRRVDPQEEESLTPCVELEHIAQETGELLGYTTAGQQLSTKNRFTSGQILFGKLRPYLRKYIQTDFSGICSSEIWVLSGKQGRCLNKYLFYLIQTDRFINAANVSSGTHMPRADWNYVSEFSFALPHSLDEQQRIADVLSKNQTITHLLSTYLLHLRQQKKGLMQRLLTGQVRVGVEGESQ